VDPETKLDRGIKALVGTGPADYAPEDWVSLREQFRLLILYPGKFVACRDHYQVEGVIGRLARREVLCASRSLAVVQKWMDKLPEEELRSVDLTYVEKTNSRSRAR
jgi:hypothetical protein